MFKQKINKLLIGTNNKGKLREIKSLLPKSIKIHSTSEFNLKSPIENGKTFKENNNRVGKNPYFYPITFPESVEIDDKEDWELAKRVYGK